MAILLPEYITVSVSPTSSTTSNEITPELIKPPEWEIRGHVKPQRNQVVLAAYDGCGVYMRFTYPFWREIAEPELATELEPDGWRSLRPHEIAQLGLDEDEY